MTVQDTLRVPAAPVRALVPQQAGPTDPSVAAPTPSAPLLGRDRPLTADERQFAIGLALLALVLGTIVVGGLLLGQYVWS